MNTSSQRLRGDREHRSRLGEVVRPGQAALQRLRPAPPELAVGVPPLGAIHLADPCDDEAQLEQPLEIDVWLREVTVRHHPPRLLRSPGSATSRPMDGPAWAHRRDPIVRSRYGHNPPYQGHLGRHYRPGPVSLDAAAG